MKQLTLKDFIKYSSPCFGCGSPINIILASISDDKSVNTDNFSSIKPSLLQDSVEFDLKITYTKTLKLKIFYKTNEFICSNLRDLTEYLKKYKLHLRSGCPKCNSNMRTDNLLFNFKKQYLLPLTVNWESVYVFDHKTRKKYSLYAHRDLNKSIIRIDDLSVPLAPKSMELEVPFLNVDKLKTKEKFINKVNTLLIFS